MLPNIKLNYLYFLLNKISIVLTQLVIISYVSRIFGPEKIGIQSYTISISYVFIVLATFGIFTLGQREIARKRDDKEQLSQTFWNIYSASTIKIAFIAIIWLCFFVFTASRYQSYFCILTISVLATLFDITWLYIGLEEFKKILIRNVLIKCSILFSIFVLIKTEEDLHSYLLIISLSELIGNLSLWVNIKKIISGVSIKKIHPLSYIKNSINYYIPSISLSIYILVDKIMIGLITGSETYNGLYEQTANIILLIEVLLAILSNVLSPRLSYLFEKGETKKIIEKINTALDYFLLLVFPLIFGIALIADDFVPFFLGEKFNDVICLVYLMCPIPLFVCLSNMRCLLYVTPSGKLYITNRIMVFGVLINIVGNYLIIPAYGVKGAIVASLISEIIIACLYVFVSKNYVNIRNVLFMSYKKIIACLVMSLFVLLYKQIFDYGAINILLEVGIGAFCYFSTLFLLKDGNFFTTISRFIKKSY